MKYRKLQIRWSVAWGILGLLMIWYSARCYSRSYFVGINLGGPTYDAYSRYGFTFFSTIQDGNVIQENGSRPKAPRMVFRSQRIRHSNDYYVASNPLELEIAYRIVPHWLPVALLGLFAAAPWLRWRFSLRTLLIGMTLVAVALGFIIAMSP